MGPEIHKKLENFQPMKYQIRFSVAPSSGINTHKMNLDRQNIFHEEF